MNLFSLPRISRQLRLTGRVLGGLLLAASVPITAITASAAGPIASSTFAGVENPLSEGGTWVPLTSLWPFTGELQKNDGAFPNQPGHAGARTTAAVPADQYSEIVVGAVGGPQSNVGPIVRVQTSGPSIDSHYLWWVSRPDGVNGLYRIDATGTGYTAFGLLTTSGVVAGDRLRLIARGPVIYGIKNGVREFIYNPHAASSRYPTGTTGVLTYAGDGVVEDAKIASWSTGAAPASSGTWASTTFSGTEDPLDEGDRWYPLPSYEGFRKQDGMAIGRSPNHNAAGVWSITPPATQYSQVTLGTVSSGGGGGPIVRINRNVSGQTGWLLLLWAPDPSASGIYKLFSDESGAPLFSVGQLFPSAPTIAAGDAWGLAADGNVLTVSKNGVPQFSWTTDGSYASGDVGIETYDGFGFSAWEGGAALDVQPPTAPTNLTATAVSGSQINLAWSASTDDVGVTGYNIERCQGSGCSNFAQIATVTGTTYNNTGLTNATSYSYRVRATDAAGNPSPYSNVAWAATPDTQAPTAPASLNATTRTSTRVDLAWTASTDNVGVTAYQIERCLGANCSNFTTLASVTGTTHSDTTVTADKIYRYRVRATDAAGNLSSYSNIASANTDTTKPTTPTALTALGASSTQVNLMWTAATDNVAVTGYIIERSTGLGSTNFTQIATVTSGTSYTDSGRTPATVYNYRIRATDLAGNTSDYSNTATATTLAVGL